MSPFSAWIWQTLSRAAIRSMALQRNSSETMRLPRFLYVMNILNERTPSLTASGMPSRMAGSCSAMKWKTRAAMGALICLRGGPRHGPPRPPRPPTLGAPRGTQGAPRPCACSSVRLLLRDGLQQRPVVLRLAPAEEVPALAHRSHLIEVDARGDQLVAGRRGPGDDLTQRVDHAAAADQLHAVLDARLGHADHEARVGVGARAHAEIVQVERERGDRRVVADEDDLGALQRQRAVALGIAAVLADRDADPRARAVPDAVAGVAVGEVVGLVDLGEAVGRLRARQVNLAEGAEQAPVTPGGQRRIEGRTVRLLAKTDMYRDH